MLLNLLNANELVNKVKTENMMLLDKVKTKNMLLLDKVKNLKHELSITREQTNRTTSSKLEHMFSI